MTVFTAAPFVCPNADCGSAELSWSLDTLKAANGVVDGRLTMHDVRAALVLGCDECSETITIIEDLSAVHIMILSQESTT